MRGRRIRDDVAACLTICAIAFVIAILCNLTISLIVHPIGTP